MCILIDACVSSVQKLNVKSIILIYLLKCMYYRYILRFKRPGFQFFFFSLTDVATCYTVPSVTNKTDVAIIIWSLHEVMTHEKVT